MHCVNPGPRGVNYRQHLRRVSILYWAKQKKISEQKGMAGQNSQLMLFCFCLKNLFGIFCVHNYLKKTGEHQRINQSLNILFEHCSLIIKPRVTHWLIFVFPHFSLHYLIPEVFSKLSLKQEGVIDNKRQGSVWQQETKLLDVLGQ